jgi:hypothetical protein
MMDGSCVDSSGVSRKGIGVSAAIAVALLLGATGIAFIAGWVGGAADTSRAALVGVGAFALLCSALLAVLSGVLLRGTTHRGITRQS